jgi:predicted nucleotidyltransferase
MLAMRDIQTFSDVVAREFKPQRIILFGSHAYGSPGGDSDVDLLIVMRYRGHPVRKAIEIRQRIDAPFALDLIVRSPRELRERYRLGDWFIREILDKGKVLYEAAHPRMDR